jgi:hypothetical protein
VIWIPDMETRYRDKKRGNPKGKCRKYSCVVCKVRKLGYCSAAEYHIMNGVIHSISRDGKMRTHIMQSSITRNVPGI